MSHDFLQYQRPEVFVSKLVKPVLQLQELLVEEQIVEVVLQVAPHAYFVPTKEDSLPQPGLHKHKFESELIVDESASQVKLHLKEVPSSDKGNAQPV